MPEPRARDAREFERQSEWRLSAARAIATMRSADDADEAEETEDTDGSTSLALACPACLRAPAWD